MCLLFSSGIFSNRERFNAHTNALRDGEFLAARSSRWIIKQTGPQPIEKKGDLLCRAFCSCCRRRGFTLCFFSSSSSSSSSEMPLNCGNNNLLRNYNRGGVTSTKALFLFSLSLHASRHEWRFSSARDGGRGTKEGIELKFGPSCLG